MQPDQRRGRAREAVFLGVRQSQALRQPLRVLRNGNDERGQSQKGVRRRSVASFDGDGAFEPTRIGEAEQRPQNPALAHDANDLAGAGRDEELQNFGAHPLARQPREFETMADGRVQSVPIERSGAESRREPEEAQDAKIVFPNALIGVADEADAARREVV